jgi:cytochrome P450
MAFANYEMKIVAARVLLRLRMELPRNYDGTPTRRSITLAPAKRLPVKLRTLR